MQQLTGGMSLARQCAMMGEPWIKYNWQKEKMMYLELSWEFSEEMKEAWSSFERYTKEDGEPQMHKNDDQENAAKRRKLEDRSKEIAEANIDGQKKVEDKKKSDEEKKKGDEEKKKGDPMTEALKAASKYKATYLKCTTESTLILSQIVEDEAWMWADNEQNKGKLQRLQKKVNDNHGSLQRKFLTEDIGKVKMKVSKEELMVSLRNLATDEAKQRDLSELATFLRTIKSRHGV